MILRFSPSLRRLLTARLPAAALTLTLSVVMAVPLGERCMAAEQADASSTAQSPDTGESADAAASARIAPGHGPDANASSPGDSREPHSMAVRPNDEARKRTASRGDTQAASNAPDSVDATARSRKDKASTPAIPVPPESTSVTTHSLRVNGRKLDYTATAGNLLLHDKSGAANASVFYVAYTVPTKTPAARPITFLFNGGPGAGSVFLMMGSVGPKRVRTASPASTPPAPYTLEDNPDSLLDISDLVFIDAVGAGLSRPVGHGTGKDFWGVDQDVDAFAQFIDRYLTANQRWNSPKYLLGESYGTARAAMLAYRLGQNNIALNGVILLSSVLNSAAFSPGTDFKSESYLPSFAAIAWYHDKVTPKPASLPAFLDEARAFARGPYAQALEQGDALPDDQRDAIAARIAYFTGLDVGFVKRNRLRLYPSRFRNELLRSESRSVGRYDARFEGVNFDDASEDPDFDASVSSVSNAFNAALHQHLEEDLHYAPTERYLVFSDDALKQWDWKHREWWGERLQLPYAGGDLAEAMRQNPQLRVLSLNGYFDLATPFYATEYALAHLGLDGPLRENLRIAYYPTGHMIYLDDAALHAMKRDLASFYASQRR
ncbi:peptidase S10 [Paraburkholderia sprentiae WSM5005]|uniref:Peptidase S10 n=1 Tax=Paraburkholderia sprentiae WSM5005 TaxID=754502 RepID=A0A1I9YSY7_9BURK|nr:peptidase S10 [Paraburkholderia sprentiae]APA89330.1 peptidase S10 [Paraburkholderia sprentiae WSM5005]